MKALLLPTWVLLVATAAAQNLVPNGSFEEYTQCPDFWNQINRATGWSAFRNTPDYFNSCDSVGGVSVPLNFVGNHFATDGEAYAAIIAWQTGGLPNYREHFGAELTIPLIPHVPVFLSFKIIMATRGIQNDCRWSVDGIGMRFVMSPYTQNNNSPLINQAALHLTSAPLDTIDWTKVSGMYVPDSAYRYIVIGGFFSDDLVNPVRFNPGGVDDMAFAFIDDVCVSYNPSDCGIEASLYEHSQTRFHTFPNPFTTDVRVYLNEPATSCVEVWMQDFLGRRVWSGRLHSGQSSFTIDGTHLPEGIYVIFGKKSGEVLPSAVVVRVSP